MNREIDHTGRTRQIGTTRIGSAGAALLFLIGLGLVAAGTALAAAPYYAAPNPSGDYWKYATLAATHGIKFDMVVITGLLLMGLGLIGRCVSRMAKVLGRLQDQGTGSSQVTGQLATDMTHTMRTLSAVVQSLNQSSREPEPETAGPDALFRLAASLDQLGAQLDQRMEGELGAMSGQLEVISRGQENLAARVAAFESSLASTDRSEQTPTTPPMGEAFTTDTLGGQGDVTTSFDTQDEVFDLFDSMNGEVGIDSPANQAPKACDPPSGAAAQTPLELPPGYGNARDPILPEDFLRDAPDRDR